MSRLPFHPESLLISSLQKCTGTRPVCEQCTQMKRAHECQYDDSSKKSRTQTLREKVALLEAKLRDMEDESNLSKFSAPICESLPVHDRLPSPMIHHQDSGSSTYTLDPNDNLTDSSSSHGRIGTPRIDNPLTSYTCTRQGMSPFSLTDSSGGDSSNDQIFEPIVSLSAEMHNTLYGCPQNISIHSTDCFKASKLLSGIIDNAVSTQTLVDSTRHHPLQSFNAPHPTLP